MAAKGSGVTSLTSLRARCSIARPRDPDCCWIWKGCLSHGQPAIWLEVDGKARVVTGVTAATVLVGREVPEGHRRWQKCADRLCCNPAHTLTGTYKEWGAWVREQKLWVGSVRRKVASRANGRRRSKIDADIARQMRESTLPQTEEAKRWSEVLGIPISHDLVSDVRNLRRWADATPFDGLGAR